MQDTAFNDIKYKTRAHRLLSCSLQELNGQKDAGDTHTVADLLGLSVRTVEVYLSGSVAVLDTGRKIFTSLRNLIVARENDVRRMVGEQELGIRNLD